MYSAAQFPKTISWLLAIMLVVQPVSGIPCVCNKQETGAARLPTNCGCCCCSQGLATCCAKLSSQRQPCCHCQHKMAPGSAAPTICTCNCESNAPAVPPSLPTQQSKSVELGMPMICAYILTVKTPQVPQEFWALDLPDAFASASEHCIALCRLQF